MKRSWVTLAIFGCAALGCGGAEPPADAPPLPEQEAASSEAALNPTPCNLYFQTACLLNPGASRKTLAVHYAGLQFCKLQLISLWDVLLPGDLDSIAKELRATIDGTFATGFAPVEMTPKLVGDVIEYELTTEAAYIAEVNIETRTGEDFESLFNRTMRSYGRGQRSFVALPIRCEGAPR